MKSQSVPEQPPFATALCAGCRRAYGARIGAVLRAYLRDIPMINP